MVALKVIATRVESCPHLRGDNVGYYCSKDMESDNITSERRIITDRESRLIWCNAPNYVNCCFYKEPSSFKDQASP